jgi:hypothetical protein
VEINSAKTLDDPAAAAALIDKLIIPLIARCGLKVRVKRTPDSYTLKISLGRANQGR